MAVTHTARKRDHGKELAHLFRKGGRAKTRALIKQWNIEHSPRSSSSTGGVIPISVPSSKRTSRDTTTKPTFSKGKEPAQESFRDEPSEKPETKAEQIDELGNTLAKPTQEDERFQDNPIGVGCHRWFSCGSWCPASETFCSTEKPLPQGTELSELPHESQKPQQCPAGSGHNGICDTPGMKLIKDGVTAVRKLGSHNLVFDTPGTEMIKSCFKLIKSGFNASKSKGKEQAKPMGTTVVPIGPGSSD